MGAIFECTVTVQWYLCHHVLWIFSIGCPKFLHNFTLYIMFCNGETLLQRTTIFPVYVFAFFQYLVKAELLSDNFLFYLECLDIFKNCFYLKSGNLGFNPIV